MSNDSTIGQGPVIENGGAAMNHHHSAPTTTGGASSSGAPNANGDVTPDPSPAAAATATTKQRAASDENGARFHDDDEEEEEDDEAGANHNNNDDSDDDELDVGEVKLFDDLEHEQEEQQHQHDHDQQPKDVQSAPALLRAALEKGELAADDSEQESFDGNKVQALKEQLEAMEDAEQKGGASPGALPRMHQRANQLEFLLEKASEFSRFIADDLEDLQRNLSEQAQAEENNSNGNKKRKKGALSKATKKQKNEKAAAALQDAQEQDEQMRINKRRAIFTQPRNLNPDCELKDYQLEGVRWLVSLYENGVSGILADEMGLGKTIQCVALIAHLLLQGVSGPFLIVAPLATLPNWVREFEKWLPSHPVVRYHGTAPERDALLAGVLHHKRKLKDDFPFIVTSYEVAIRDQGKLSKLCELQYLIVDEGHRIKNRRCLLLSSLKKLTAANRLLLTGTPIQNNLDELWSLLNFVNPSIFDDLSVFQSWFGFRDIGKKSYGATQEESILVEQRENKTVSKLHEILRPFLLRRVKSDVLREMPPKKEVIVYSGISKLQAGYADMIDKGILRDTLTKQGIEDGRTLSQTNKVMNHRKNINHPFLFGEPIDPNTGMHMGTAHPQLLVRASGKFALLDRMLTRLHRDGHQVLIFSQMTKVLNVMEDYLRFREWKYCRIDGSVQVDERQRQMDDFNAEKTAGVNGTRNEADDRHFVFLLSTRAGGLGINLTGADTCIIFDSDWNPHADRQAMDRCHRLGQTHPVAVYRLLTVNSVDIDMMEQQISKKKLERMTIAGGDFRKAGGRSMGNFDVEHLTSLLKNDITDMNAKGGDVEDVKIDDEEFEMIMNRKTLFTKGKSAIPTEGKMYDVVDNGEGERDVLGAMNA